MNTGQKIKARAKKVGIPVYELLRRANVSHTLLDTWLKKEPMTLEYLERINCILEIEEEKQGIISLKKKVLFFLELFEGKNDLEKSKLKELQIVIKDLNK
jgi:transcriptional regulator with XRE-family HTH domain